MKQSSLQKEKINLFQKRLKGLALASNISIGVIVTMALMENSIRFIGGLRRFFNKFTHSLCNLYHFTNVEIRSTILKLYSLKRELANLV
jgi:hypothetical protein